MVPVPVGSRPTPERNAALKALDSILDRGAYTNLELDELFDASPRERERSPFITELVNGTVRRTRTLDFIIEASSGRNMDKLHPTVANILRIGLYQILFMDSVPEHVAVNESVLLAHANGQGKASGLVNAVLRGLLRKVADIPDHAVASRMEGFPETSMKPMAFKALMACGLPINCDYMPNMGLGLLESHPEWLVESWMGQFGEEEAWSLCRTNNQAPAVHIRTNLLRISRDALMDRLREEGVSCEPGIIAPECIRCYGLNSIGESEAFAQGLYQVQDEGAMAVSQLLDPRKGESVLDVCAAPGGKATHCAELMGDVGRVVALDSNRNRLGLVDDNSRRLGLTSIESVAMDARRMPERFRTGEFHRILVDAPCSGTGVVRRKPDIRWRRELSDLDALIRIQREILRATVPLLAHGGILVYSTCSLQWEENEGNLRWLIEEFPEMRVDGGGEGWYYLPHINGTDGFYAVKLIMSR